ncbi:MAG TPA: hypothetical protein DIS74_08060 [Bacteroidales bacterium]|nr:hypothetical protein [Bacteroidales bacterium]
MILRLFSQDSLISRRDSLPIDTIFVVQESAAINNKRKAEMIKMRWVLFRFMLFRVIEYSLLN